MGYYKDTGSLWSMASAEAILKKRMPEKVGILPVAELLFVAESMWVGEHDMKGHFHPSFRFVKAKRYNAKPHILDLGMSEEEAEKIGIPITQTWKRISRSRY